MNATTHGLDVASECSNCSGLTHSVGGTIPYMEDLKERRRKLVDRNYHLRC